MICAKKILKKAVSIGLIMGLTLTSPLGVNAAKIASAEKKLYVKELVFSYGKTEEDAEKWLKDNGYKVVSGDIHEGTGNEYKTVNAVLMGYKTTTDASEAVKDISVMPMTGGFKVTDMENILNKQNNAVNEGVSDLKELADEYKANYKTAIKSAAKGGTKGAEALRTHDMLNKYVEDDSGIGMGDLLLKNFSKAENSSILKKVILQGNPQSVGVIYNILAMAGGDSDSTWVEKVEKLNKKKTFYNRMKVQYKTAKRAKDYLDKQYGDYRDTIESQIDDLQDRFDEAEDVIAYIDKNNKGNKITAEMIYDYYDYKENEIIEVNDKSSEEKKLEAFSKNLDTIDKANDVAALMETINLEGYLEGFKYGKGTLLDFLKSDFDFSSGNDKYEVLALLEAMTDSQINSLGKTTNLFTAIKYAMIGEDSVWGKKYKSTVKELDSTIKEIDKTSIYEGVNREVFEGEVAITSAADTRDANVFYQSDTSLAGAITGTVFGAIITLMGAYIITSTISNLRLFQGYYAGVVYGAFRSDIIVKSIMSNILKSKLGDEAMKDGLITLMRRYANSTGEKIGDLTAREVQTMIYQARETALKVVLAIGIVIAVAGIILSAWSIWKIVENQKEKNQGDYSVDIPRFMADITFEDDGSEEFVMYEACKCNRNAEGMTGKKESNSGLKDYADINGDTGKFWLTPFVTKDSRAGKPILADSFKVSHGDVSFDEDERRVHLFDEYNTGLNLTSEEYNFNDSLKGTYITYKTDNNYNQSADNTDSSNDTATAFTRGRIAMVLLIGALGGLFAGGFATYATIKKKKEEE